MLIVDRKGVVYTKSNVSATYSPFYMPKGRNKLRYNYNVWLNLFELKIYSILRYSGIASGRLLKNDLLGALLPLSQTFLVHAYGVLNTVV